jgi:hypothetical protein
MLKETVTNRTEHIDSESVAEELPHMNALGDSSATLIGRIAAPSKLESTADQFYFWVQRNRFVENTQLVRTESTIDGEKIEFFGVIDEVRRLSRKRDIQEEFDSSDGDAEYDPEFKSEGVTYASVKILRTQPNVLTPPIEQSLVHLGDEATANESYGFSDMAQPLAVGRLCNGATKFAGLGKIDLSYLLGENGGHVNVTGMAGGGTKTTLLLTLIKTLHHEAEVRLQRKHERGKASMSEPLFVVPIILNVKGEDLMWLDRPNRHFGSNPKRHDKEDWDALDIEPKPFENAEFFTPTDPDTECSPTINGCNAKAYSWSLSDVLADESFPYLFSSEDNPSPAMMALVYDIAARLTKDDNKTLRNDASQTWEELINWVRTQAGTEEKERDCKMHQTGTWRAIYRRLFDILTEGKSVFPRKKRQGNPLRVVRDKSSPPQVIDIHSLTASLQRFVVGTIIKQVVASRTTRNPTTGLRYLIMLDELNRFAPKGSTDEITKLLERVATEMRSQGVLLFGAQQLASQVSTKVIEMSSIRVLGRTGSGEMQDKVWQSWGKAAREQGCSLKLEQKLISQPTFRQPMLIQTPYPAWAMKREDIAPTPVSRTREV